MIGAAASGGLPATALVVLSSSAVAIWHTVRGVGPFAGQEIHDSLILLQVFLGVLAATALLLGAAITERQASERRERDAATMLRLAQRAGGVATFVWDFRRQVADASAEFFRIFGLAPRDGVMQAVEWNERVHPDDRDRMNAHLGRAIKGAEPATADYRITTPDGHVRWVSYAGQLRATGDGDRMFGTVLDITDRKQLEAELRHHAADLRESRDVLSLAMRGGSMGAWSQDLSTNAVWWSRELEEIFGLEPGGFDHTEAGFFEFVHPEDRPAVRRVVDEAVDHRTDYTVEFRFKHARGEWRWMEGRGRAVYHDDGTPPPCTESGLTSPTANVRKWRCSRPRPPRNRDSSGWPRPIASSADACSSSRRCWTCCRLGSVSRPTPSAASIRVNRAFAQTLGVSPGTNASKTASVEERPTNFRVFTPDGSEVPDDQLPMQVAARDGKEAHELEFDIVHDDGRTVRLLEYAAPLMDEQGRPRGAVGAFVDLTAAHQTRVTLARSEERYRPHFRDGGRVALGGGFRDRQGGAGFAAA